MNPRESRLRDEYVSGRIEVDEFEQRIEAILRDEPLPQDRPSAALAAVLKEAWTDKPGEIHYYRPSIDGLPEWAWRDDSALSTEA